MGSRKSWRRSEFCHSVLYCIASALRGIFCLSYSITSLVEQAKAREKQEQKVNGLTKELEAAISDRDSLMEKYQTAGTEMERVKAELDHTQTE